MFLSFFISGVEATLTTIEAVNVIGMRVQMLAKGDAQAAHESKLMVSEKIEAFAQAGRDFAMGTSNSEICENFRVLIRANEARLIELSLVARRNQKLKTTVTGSC